VVRDGRALRWWCGCYGGMAVLWWGMAVLCECCSAIMEGMRCVVIMRGGMGVCCCYERGWHRLHNRCLCFVKDRHRLPHWCQWFYFIFLLFFKLFFLTFFKTFFLNFFLYFFLTLYKIFLKFNFFYFLLKFNCIIFFTFINI